MFSTSTRISSRQVEVPLLKGLWGNNQDECNGDISPGSLFAFALRLSLLPPTPTFRAKS